ncbi:MAG: group II truncated hemoglobin [Candidatus Methylopumilus sp.]
MPSNNSLYDELGGDVGVRHLVETFYNIVETDEDAQKLHILHLRGSGIANSKTEQHLFMSGFLGGPKLYLEKHGHANLKTMHEHVVVDEESKDIWLNCMEKAMNAVALAEDTQEKLMRIFRPVAERLVNQPST